MNLFRVFLVSCFLVFCFSSCDGQDIEELADKSLMKKQQTLEQIDKMTLRITITNSTGEEYAEDVDLTFNLLAYRSRPDKKISEELLQNEKGNYFIRTEYRIESGEEYAEDVDLGFNLLSY